MSDDFVLPGKCRKCGCLLVLINEAGRYRWVDRVTRVAHRCAAESEQASA